MTDGVSEARPVDAPRPASNTQLWTRATGYIALALAGALVALIELRALTHPALPYDDWWYHLPFAAAMFGIGGDTFHWSAMLQERWRGFPKLWDFVFGGMWAATGSLRFIMWPMVVLFSLYVWGVARDTKAPVSWVVLAFYACPLLLLHSFTGYTDLPVAVGLAGASLAMLAMIAGAPATALRIAIVVAGFGLAGNIKYQGLMAVGGMGLGLAGLAWWRGRGRLVAVVAFGGALASASCAYNAIAFSNPLYPLEVRALGHVIFAGPENPDYQAEFPAYAGPNGSLVHLPEPINFALSASEVDFWLRGAPFHYRVDQKTDIAPLRGAPARTGGWGMAFVLANVVGLIAQRLQRQPLDPSQRIYWLGAIGALLLVAVLPRSHELRYWLFAPLIVSAVNLRWLATWTRPYLASSALLALALVSLGMCLRSPHGEVTVFHAIDPARIAAQRPQAVVDALARTGRYCDPEEETLFTSASAVTGQPGLVSNRAEDCR